MKRSWYALRAYLQYMRTGKGAYEWKYYAYAFLLFFAVCTAIMWVMYEWIQIIEK